MTNYTIKHYRHGIAIFARDGMEVIDLVDVSSIAHRKGYTIMDAVLAEKLGTVDGERCCVVFTTPEKARRWRQEVEG